MLCQCSLKCNKTQCQMSASKKVTLVNSVYGFHVYLFLSVSYGLKKKSKHFLHKFILKSLIHLNLLFLSLLQFFQVNVSPDFCFHKPPYTLPGTAAVDIIK